MKKRVLWVVLIVSLALNAVFASWFTLHFVANHIHKKEQPGQIAIATSPGHIGPHAKIRAKNTIKDYIQETIDDESLYTPVSWRFEKAYISPYNDLTCARAASRIIDLRQRIKDEEIAIQNFKRLQTMSPVNMSVQMSIDQSENRLIEYKQAIITNERTIIMRNNRQDGQPLGWSVTHTFTVKTEDGNKQTVTNRFIVSPNGKELSLQQGLDPWDYQNYDRTCEVIRDVLADYGK